MAEEQFVMLNYGFRKEKKGRRWLGECIELGTSTYGNSLDDVKEKLEEAVSLHLNTLEEVGERERFFEEHNIKLYTSKSEPRSFTVPAPPSRNEYIHPHRQSIPVGSGV